MALSADQRVAKRNRPLEALELSPEEYFVLSRVEGAPTVGELLAISGLSRDDTERILDRLLALGVLALSEAIPKPQASSSAPKVDSRLRDKVMSRRKALLRAQLGPGTLATPSTNGTATRLVSGATSPEETLAVAAPDDASLRFELPLASPEDGRLDPTLAIGFEDQRWVLALADGQDTWTPFEFLGLLPTHDLKVIKRAFHETSRRLHPDAYYGRNLGIYRDLLDELFQRAKSYHAQLRSSQVRDPYVEQAAEHRARQRREASAERERARRRAEAAQQLREAQEEAERAMRRDARERRRVTRERQQIQERLHEEGRQHRVAAQEAEGAGKLAKAANLYRLALRAEPNDDALRRKWEEVLALARKKRAAEAYGQAQRYLDLGHTREAVPLLVEAARAHATLEHLAHAADAVREDDPALAREFAIAALNALTREAAHREPNQGEGSTDEAKPKKRPTTELVALRVMMGRAFLAAGQKETAKEQALVAREHRPEDPEVRALLKSLKVK